jgi:glycosyltransferase involved in cell wall biosynthesis
VKILHLFSDWKWTGPSEPVLNLCHALEQRGHDVTLAYRRPPYPTDESLDREVRKAGVKATDRFYLNHQLSLRRPASLWESLSDFTELTRTLRAERFDVVNVHHSHDHVLGGLAARRAGVPTVVIRTDHKRDPLRPSPGNRWLISRFTDGMITFSERARKEDAARFGLPPERVVRIHPALVLDRYRPEKPWKPMRPVYGIGAGETVIGMVARFQKYRRTEAFLEAMAGVIREFPRTRLLLVGRSSQMEESVVAPMKRMGIEDHVVLAGYRTDDYLDTLACMDLFVFLMAGSDGTARALREAMAMGKPVIAAERGMLPELVEDGVSGRVVRDEPDVLGRAVLDLLRRPEERERLGRNAREKALRDFPLEGQAEAVERFYRETAERGPWRRR